MGGDALRVRALSDPEVIAALNERAIPVWIDIKQHPLPDVQGVNIALGDTVLDEERRIVDEFSLTFFVRNLVLDPEGRRLDPRPAKGPLGSFLTRGHLPYAQIGTRAFLDMLDRSIAHYEQRKAMTRWTGGKPLPVTLTTASLSRK